MLTCAWAAWQQHSLFQAKQPWPLGDAAGQAEPPGRQHAQGEDAAQIAPRPAHSPAPHIPAGWSGSTPSQPSLQQLVKRATAGWATAWIYKQQHSTGSGPCRHQLWPCSCACCAAAAALPSVPCTYVPACRRSMFFSWNRAITVQVPGPCRHGSGGGRRQLGMPRYRPAAAAAAAGTAGKRGTQVPHLAADPPNASPRNGCTLPPCPSTSTHQGRYPTTTHLAALPQHHVHRVKDVQPHQLLVRLQRQVPHLLQLHSHKGQ